MLLWLLRLLINGAASLPVLLLPLHFTPPVSPTTSPHQLTTSPHLTLDISISISIDIDIDIDIDIVTHIPPLLLCRRHPVLRSPGPSTFP